MWVVKELLYSQRQIQLKLSLYKPVKEMFIKKDEQKCRVLHGVTFRTVRAWGPFLESPDNYRAHKAVTVVVYTQDRGFSSFASNMIKL